MWKSLGLAAAIGAASPVAYDYATAPADSIINYQSVVRVDNLKGAHGSGVILGPQVIATAKHVAEIKGTLFVIDEKGNKYKVTNIYKSKTTDIAYLYVDKPFATKKAEITCAPVQPLERLYIVGYPLDFPRGVYENVAVGYYDPGIDQYDVVLLATGVSLPGDSGGPVFNSHGQFVGILVGEYFTEQGDSDLSIIIPAKDTGGLCKPYA